MTFLGEHCWFFNVTPSGYKETLSHFSEDIYNLQQFCTLNVCKQKPKHFSFSPFLILPEFRYFFSNVVIFTAI